MGEEPERLREALGTALEVLRINAEVRSDGPDYIGLTMDESRALLAEVERLAGDNERLERLLDDALDGVKSLHGRVERLAGERDEMQAERDAIQAGYDTLSTAFARADKHALEWERELRDSRAECERLAGRVAALESALAEAADWLDVDLAHAPDTPISMADRSLVASWREVLGDVGSSERHEKLLGFGVSANRNVKRSPVMVHHPRCPDPSKARLVCRCGANVACSACGWGSGQFPCKCSRGVRSD